MLALAFLVGTGIALGEARRLRLDEDRLITGILITLVAAVLGARGVYLVEHVDEVRPHLGGAVGPWGGGGPRSTGPLPRAPSGRPPPPPHPGSPLGIWP